MLPNMKFYVVSIVAIFTALAVGIYIGFSMDTEGFITEQQEKLVDIVESQFESLSADNQLLKIENEDILLKNKNINKYIEESYNYLVPGKLEGKKVAIIETTDYVSSSLAHDLEKAGAKVVSLTSIDRINKDELSKVLTYIVDGTNREDVVNYISKDKMDFIGLAGVDIDHIIISGGCKYKENNRVLEIDKRIVDFSKERGIDITGVEKTTVNNSYMSKYKEYGINTIDNVDMKAGKIATVLSLVGERGNYGIKGTADSIIPLK